MPSPDAYDADDRAYTAQRAELERALAPLAWQTTIAVCYFDNDRTEIARVVLAALVKAAIGARR